jgi:ABC-2 type transport system ATP-binding protein
MASGDDGQETRGDLQDPAVSASVGRPDSETPVAVTTARVSSWWKSARGALTGRLDGARRAHPDRSVEPASSERDLSGEPPAGSASEEVPAEGAPSASASTALEGPAGPLGPLAPDAPESPIHEAVRPEAEPAAEPEPAVDETAVGETPVDHTPRPEAGPGRRTAPPSAPVPAPERLFDPATAPVVLSISGLVKRYGATTAVENIDLEVQAGSFYGIVGPNGAGKTTTLSIATGLLRPDAGTVTILGTDVWSSTEAAKAKRSLGVLPDRLRLFDRLTGAQFLYYAATLRGLDGATARKRSADLADAFGLRDALGRLVSDYSVGMTKKVALAAAIIHSPRVLVLDEPFESVDPVSAATVTEILQRYVRGGGTVLLSSHSMDLVERICDSVAVIVDGHVLAQGTVDEVRAGRSLQERFIELAGGGAATEGMEWLHNFSD